MTNREQIREELRKVLNQILDEEYDNILKEVEDKEAKLSNTNKTEAISLLLLPKNNIKEDGEGLA